MTPSIPSSSITKFFMAGAPTGWTKLTSNDDCAIRVTSGSVSSGGTTSFTSTFTSKTASGVRNVTLSGGTTTANVLPSHTHPASGQNIFTLIAGNPAGGAPYISALVWPGVAGQYATGSTGGGTGHGHSMTTPASINGPITSPTSINFAVNYLDVIIAQRN